MIRNKQNVIIAACCGNKGLLSSKPLRINITVAIIIGTPIQSIKIIKVVVVIIYFSFFLAFCRNRLRIKLFQKLFVVCFNFKLWSDF